MITFTPAVRRPDNFARRRTDAKLERLRWLYNRFNSGGYQLKQEELDAAAAELQAALVDEFEERR